jgi:hypothetical protein
MFGLGSSVDPGVSDGNRPHCQPGQTSRLFDDGKLKYTKNAAYRIKLKDN